MSNGAWEFIPICYGLVASHFEYSGKEKLYTFANSGSKGNRHDVTFVNEKTGQGLWIDLDMDSVYAYVTEIDGISRVKTRYIRINKNRAIRSYPIRIIQYLRANNKEAKRRLEELDFRYDFDHLYKPEVTDIFRFLPRIKK